MRRLAFCAFITSAFLFISGIAVAEEGSVAKESSLAKAHCGAERGKCLKKNKKKKIPQVVKKQTVHKNPPIRVTGKRVLPPKKQDPATPISSPGEPRLTAGQQEMQKLFGECIKYSTPENPVSAVKEFIFSEQRKLEDAPGWRALLAAIHGSRTHHTQEICFARAYGLKGFRSIAEIKAETGRALVPIVSPYVEVVESEIPPERRLARNWTRDYVVELGEAMHQYFIGKKGSTFGAPPLRITSMIRSFDDQAYQVRMGKSPADCRHRFLCSTHTTGSSLDLGFRDVSAEQVTWLRNKLIEDQRAQKIYFIVERDHFHVFVIPPEYIGEE